MTDFLAVLRETPHDESVRHDSLQSRLGWRGYYTFGEGSDCTDGVEVYYDKDFDYIEGLPKYILDLDKKYLVALASYEMKTMFVLENFFEQLKRDTSGMGLAYVAVSSFDDKIFYCSDISMLPENLSNIRWIDDDFMYDENKDFDLELFYEIDSGAKYLNPNHFSLTDIFYYLLP